MANGNRFNSIWCWCKLNYNKCVHIFFLWQSLIDLKIPWRRYLSNGWMSMKSELNSTTANNNKTQNQRRESTQPNIRCQCHLTCLCLFVSYYWERIIEWNVQNLDVALCMCIEETVFWQTTFGHIFPFSSTTTALERCLINKQTTKQHLFSRTVESISAFYFFPSNFCSFFFW